MVRHCHCHFRVLSLWSDTVICNYFDTLDTFLTCHFSVTVTHSLSLILVTVHSSSHVLRTWKRGCYIARLKLWPCDYVQRIFQDGDQKRLFATILTH